MDGDSTGLEKCHEITPMRIEITNKEKSKKRLDKKGKKSGGQKMSLGEWEDQITAKRMS